MRLLAYKAPIWQDAGGGATAFLPAHFDDANLLELQVTDDDAQFNGFLEGDATQTILARNADGTAFASGAGGPYFRYSLTTEAGDTFTMDLVVVGGQIVYLIPDIPEDGAAFRITNVQLVDGVTTTGLPYADLPKFHCFAPGTLIDTAAGLRPVETLRPGDRVLTYDAGLQPLVWTGGARVPWDSQSPHRPVTLHQPPCAVGQSFAPLTVSAQHRVLVAGPDVALLFGPTEAFAPAAGLTARSLGPAGSGQQVWHHLLFSDHHIVRANGLWVESLLVRDKGLSWLPAPDQAVIRAHVPDPMPPARPCLSVQEARLLQGCAGTGSRAA